MINKEDIVNIDKKTFWVDNAQNVKYQFLENGFGIIIEKNIKNNIKWDIISKNNKKILKINKNGILFYYIFDKLNEDKSYSVTYKTKDNEISSYIYKTSEKKYTKKENLSNEEKKSKNEIKKNLESKNEDLNIESSSKYNKADKLFFCFILLFVTFFISILIKMTEIFSHISILSLFFIALISSFLIVIYLREPIYYISKKYNKEIKEIFKFFM